MFSIQEARLRTTPFSHAFRPRLSHAFQPRLSATLSGHVFRRAIPVEDVGSLQNDRRHFAAVSSSHHWGLKVGGTRNLTVRTLTIWHSSCCKVKEKGRTEHWVRSPRFIPWKQIITCSCFAPSWISDVSWSVSSFVPSDEKLKAMLAAIKNSCTRGGGNWNCFWKGLISLSAPRPSLHPPQPSNRVTMIEVKKFSPFDRSVDGAFRHSRSMLNTFTTTAHSS